MNYGQRFMTLYRDRDQDHPHGKECKKAKWLSGEALQIAVKRREAKSKRERERYAQLNAELKRIARSDKKTPLSEQCKETEGKDRMEKTLMLGGIGGRRRRG